MKNLRKYLIVYILVVPGIPAVSQTADFDLYKYSEPQNWKKEERKGKVIFTDINNAEGTYGQIGLYISRQSTNDTEKEFMNDWNDLVFRYYKVSAEPDITVSVLDEYWKVAQTTVPASLNGQNFTLKLINYTGLAKTATIIATFNGDAYKRKIEEFLSSVKMVTSSDKTDQLQTGALSLSDNSVQGSAKVLSETPVNKADRQSFSKLIFKLPAGWQQQTKDNCLSVFPSHLRQGEVLEIRLLQPLNTVDFTSARIATWQEINQVWQDELQNDIFEGSTHTTSLGWNYFSEKKHTRRPGGIDTDFELFLIANGNTIERVIVISDEFRVQGSLYSTSTHFFDDIYNFVFSIRLAGKPDEASTIPSLDGGRITGVWTGISGGFSGISGTYDQKTFYVVF
ncbi:MAG: hypothetical protein EPN88_03565, partial [Bacteroidetes bacterium]